MIVVVRWVSWDSHLTARRPRRRPLRMLLLEQEGLLQLVLFDCLVEAVAGVGWGGVGWDGGLFANVGVEAQAPRARRDDAHPYRPTLC